MRRLFTVIIALLVIANCMALGGGAFYLYSKLATPPVTPDLNSSQSSSAATNTPPALPSPATPSPAFQTPLPTAIARGVPSRSETPTNSSTLDLLLGIQMPSNSRIKLAQEFKGIVPNLATPSAPRRFKVGDQDTFWVSRDPEAGKNVQVRATLRYMNDVVYMWVENGEQVDDAGLKLSADIFATQIYPTIHKFLGSEAIPGVDNDPHLHILNAQTAPNIAGYYGQNDTLPKEVNRQSNQREMFYMNSRAVKPGQDYYNSVLAHEFTHMVHRYQNLRGESSWITEGFGDLGMELSGYQAGHEQAFAADPGTQLDAWGAAGSTVPHYGAAYLFLSYQLNRFGVDFIHDVFSSNLTGIASIQYALDKHATGLTFDEVFADWVVANYLNDKALGARYGYMNTDLGIRPTSGYSRYPAQGSGTVHQYGTDYLQLLPNGKDITFTFDGSDTVRAIPTDPHSGKFMWWSGRTDLTDARLTRTVDLTRVKTATLKFWTWYSLEDNYDYAYASVSTDNGKTWKTLEGNTTTDSDPNAANYGNAFNCKSDVGCGSSDQTPEWLQEVMDLTPYAGSKVLLRFEQLTDEVYTDPGFAIDDIEIPEIGFSDNVENGGNDWTAEGFARIDNVLPQHFIVQAIEIGSTTHVVPIALDAQNRGTYQTHGFGNTISRVVITVSGSTPITWESAPYQFQIR